MSGLDRAKLMRRHQDTYPPHKSVEEFNKGKRNVKNIYLLLANPVFVNLLL